MSYKTYITDALVCGSRAQGTADKSYLLFTRDAGMLYASARSVREERSKHRYALQEFSYIRATLVHGKGGWRITGAEPLTNVYALQTTRNARALVRNVMRLLRRLIQGETSHEQLFDEVREVLDRTHAGDEDVFEDVITIRTLHELGYVALTPELAPLLSNPIGAAIAASKSGIGVPKELIEKAFQESHL